MRAIAFAILLIGCDQQEQVYVECNQTLVGAQCTVEHKAGDDPAEACWDFVIKCANGSGATASACHRVDVGAKSSKSVPIAQMNVRGDCDMATEANVVVTSIRSL